MPRQANFLFRSRSELLVVSLLDPKAQAKVYDANRLEVVSWLGMRWSATLVRCGWMPVFPEDFGGHVLQGPSSVLALKDFQMLQGVNEDRRGAGFPARRCRPPSLCALSGSYSLVLFIWELHLNCPILTPASARANICLCPQVQMKG